MDAEELAERLSAIAEELGELAYERLQEASAQSRQGGEPDPQLLAWERRLTRARRAVEKAASLLVGEQAGPEGLNPEGVSPEGVSPEGR